LLGMPIAQGQNQSARLVREADEYLALPRAVFEPYLTRRTREDVPADDDETREVKRIAARFAAEWLELASPEDGRELLARFPHIPGDLDIGLLHAAEEELGSLRGRRDL